MSPGKLAAYTHLPIIVEDDEEDETEETYHNYLATPTSPSHHLLPTTSTCSGHVVVELQSGETSAEAESDSNEEKRTSESSLTSSPEPEGVASPERGGASPEEPRLLITPRSTHSNKTKTADDFAAGGTDGGAVSSPGDGGEEMAISLDTTDDDSCCNSETSVQQDRVYKALL